MAEAEEVITDVARHATIFVRDLWRRQRKDAPGPELTALRDTAQRLDLLLSAVFGRRFLLRAAQPPAPATFLSKVFRRAEGPRTTAALPATDGHSIWLPPLLSTSAQLSGLQQFRVLALQQAQRATRAWVPRWHGLTDPLERAVYLLLEAQAADAALVRQLPGIKQALQTMRATALAARPPLSLLPDYRVPLERLARALLTQQVEALTVLSSAQCLAQAQALAADLRRQGVVRTSGRLLYRDLWTGEVRPLPAAVRYIEGSGPLDEADPATPRSARLSRRPEVREASDDEDDQSPGTWMVQTGQPHEQAEDPVGLQRPTDRDEAVAAEEFADALSELPEARLVTTPGRAREVLLSDDAPDPQTKRLTAPAEPGQQLIRYPEWDYRVQAYRENGATVHIRTAEQGEPAWVEATLRQYRTTVNLVRRRFEMLRAQRTRLYRQLDGDELDLDAYIAAYADFQAGLPMPQGLYQTLRQQRRDLAILLLVDISGSTDGWISANKRVIDVEREALLLVSIALQGMAERNAIHAFSGEGAHGVVVRVVKRFGEPFDATISRRIARLEPEHYTRAGAAIRYATTALLQQPAQHRLLLMLSDGKPNDADEYEGRYGIEDTRQAVTEAKLQGIQPFCLTVDRQAANYVPGIFGLHHYALLPKPDLLPTVLLDWLRRLLRS
ncbi:nitric oxide reductase activation protein NorD [Chitinimonas lacunae]|uniref:Nitric oxide reductase activation protein NorD n=1 Tax=Chitinimonas lacunae TaxID=1963018 RepID=A0ABV8MPZ2_9NEIS